MSSLLACEQPHILFADCRIRLLTPCPGLTARFERVLCFRYNSNVHRGVHHLSSQATAAFEAARAKVARFVNAQSPQDIVFTKNATEAINLVAYSWGGANLQPGDEVTSLALSAAPHFVAVLVTFHQLSLPSANFLWGSTHAL